MKKASSALQTIDANSRRKYLAAVASRDSSQEGAFVYGVRSTGIYCRPSCPARRPHSKQIVFFNTPGAAEDAGFRACRRCHPKTGKRNPQARLIRRICEEIENSQERRLNLRELASITGVSASHLQRIFRKAMHISPRQYADVVRVARLKSHLGKEADVTTAMLEAGYSSASRLYEQSDAQLGMTPATYRRGGRGMRISYTIADTPLGRILVAATERGISAISLGDDDGKLIAALRKEYPQAEISRDFGKRSNWVSTVVKHLADSNSHIDLPTDVVATAFQRRVWQALRAIPLGATRTYSEIASELGSPSATRAVARACATNPTSIVVPCHRVVRKNGSLGGYRWGLQRKEQLLKQERQAAKQK